MHKLDPHTLFSIFEQGDEQIYRENNVEDVLKNPYVLIGMVVTGVENYYFMDKMYSIKHPKLYGRVKSNIKHKYYSRLFKYLDRINPDEFNSIYRIGLDYEIDKSLRYMYDLLFYFEEMEEYRKCKVIKHFADLLMDRKLETLI